eukprot:14827407-Alexandrium_andersonii.AAC.1
MQNRVWRSEPELRGPKNGLEIGARSSRGSRSESHDDSGDRAAASVRQLTSPTALDRIILPKTA